MGLRGVVIVVAVGLAACKSSSSNTTPEPPRTETKTAPAPTSNTAVVADPISGQRGELKAYTPSPEAAAKREIPPDGVLRYTQVQFITSIPDLGARCPDIDAAAAFIKEAERIVVAHDAATPGAFGDKVYLWIAIKPGNQARVWFTGEPAVSLATEQDLSAKIASARPPTTTGPIVLLLPMARRQVEPSPDFPQPPDLWILAARPGDTAEQAAIRAWEKY
jgi:hypothetical protein